MSLRSVQRFLSSPSHWRQQQLHRNVFALQTRWILMRRTLPRSRLEEYDDIGARIDYPPAVVDLPRPVSVFKSLQKRIVMKNMLDYVKVMLATKYSVKKELGKVNDGLQGKFLDLGSVESVGSTMANLVLQMNQAVAKGDVETLQKLTVKGLYTKLKPLVEKKRANRSIVEYHYALEKPEPTVFQVAKEDQDGIVSISVVLLLRGQEAVFVTKKSQIRQSEGQQEGKEEDILVAGSHGRKPVCYQVQAVAFFQKASLPKMKELQWRLALVSLVEE